jgi:hypothetical protein
MVVGNIILIGEGEEISGGQRVGRLAFVSALWVLSRSV